MNKETGKMALVSINAYDQIMMSLAHYFITKENYQPINVQGAQNEIWLENLEGPYRVIRINAKSIYNDEQYLTDIFKIRFIIKQIKRKTLSFKVNTLNICLNVNNKVNLESKFNINSIKLDSVDQIKTNEALLGAFPNIQNNLIEKTNNLDLIINVTNDINEKTQKSNKLFEKVFSPKKIIITKILIFINILVFLLMYLLGNGSQDTLTLLLFGANYKPLVLAGQIWRLLTCAFVHIGLIHLLVNMYSLSIIGSQLETYVGKWKYLAIYLLSAISGSLFSLITGDSISAGASGAIFGLLGSLLYFGYHYRLYLNSVLRNQIIPIIVINLLIGFLIPGIDVLAHIGGLIGGYLATMALGLEGKSHKKDMINGWIVFILYIVFLTSVVFFVK